MICEKCGKQADGHAFTFFYGTEKGTTVIGERRTTNTVRYELSGTSSVNICKECIHRAKKKIRIIRVCFFSFLAGFVSLYLEQTYIHIIPAGIATVCIVILLALCLISTIFIGFFGFSSKGDEVGDSIAIKIKKRALKKQGFNLFLTRSGRDKMLRDSMKMKF